MIKQFKILIIHPGGIGDLIMFTPALQVLKNNFPDSAIDVFAGFTPVAAEVLRGSEIINKIFDFNFPKSSFFDKINFILKLREEKYDLTIVAAGANPLKASIFSFLINGRKSVGEYRKFKLPFYTHQVKLDGNQHKIRANLKLLKVLGITAEDVPPPFFALKNSDKQFAEEFILKNNLRNKILIGFSMGSGTAQQFKLWPSENFIELGRKVLDNFPDAHILLFGSLSEKDICSKLQNELKERVVPIIDKSLSQAAALINKCKIFVSSDTGPCHIAATTEADLIVIFGPTILERTGPVGPKVHIISEKCRYQYHDIFTPKYDIYKEHRCLEKITPERVFNKVKEILQHER